MPKRALKQLLRIRLAAILGVIFLQLVALNGLQRKRPKTNEEKARALLNDKRYSFEDLLNAKPGAVADAKKIYALTSDPELKQRLASILISIGVKDQVYREYLEHAARMDLANETPCRFNTTRKMRKAGILPSWNGATNGN